MKIGFDFDNTIVSYDALFHTVAREQNLISDTIPVNKVAVRDHLRRIGQEDRWTEMQGYVYGARMDEAVGYPGIIEFFERATALGHELAIVSHKTKHPFIGFPYDLHAVARSWVNRHLVTHYQPLFSEKSIFFELTKEEKLARIADLGFDVFIDDLPEILTAPLFPKTTHPLLFDPDSNHSLPRIPTFRTWTGIADFLGIK
jgi:hypothetical protein